MPTMLRAPTILLAVLAMYANAYEIPSNLRAIYDSHKAGNCKNVIAGGFTPDGSSDKSFTCCGDIPNATFIHSQRNGGQYADMDVDCDGANLGAGKCANDQSGLGITSWQWIIEGYNVGIPDLDANVHPYIVFGNVHGSKTFDPQSWGMKPLSVMAVVCNNQLHYGLWGDENDGELVGEASMAMADLCFPDNGLDGDHGHVNKDVLYIGFDASKAAVDPVPGKKLGSKKWQAKNAREFEGYIKAIGDKLVAGLR